MTRPSKVWIFDLGAWIYDRLTAQDHWRRQITSVLGFPALPETNVRILDLGCGPGVSTFALAEAIRDRGEVVGIDVSKKMIERAVRHRSAEGRKPENVRFERADATRLPFAAASFDLAVGHSFLYLIPDRAAVLKEVRRVLAPGATLVLMEPNQDGSLARAAAVAARGLPAALRAPSEAGRFAASMVLWRLISGLAGRLSSNEAERLLRGAGYGSVKTQPTLGGLGLHCIAVRPREPSVDPESEVR